MTPLRQLFATLTGGDAQDQDSGRNAAMINAAVIRALCEPVSAANPCGESLEYDTEYAVLHSRLSPKADVQYGKFSAKPEAPDWLEVERDARRLLLRSKDISILIWLTRARARMAGAGGLLEGLATLHALLLAHPEGIHPRIVIDGEADPAVRANALAALCDPEGLLGDVRDIVVSASTAFRLTVRDAERAFAVPRNPYAVDPENIKRQLADLYAKRDETLLALLCCSVCVEDIALWAKAALQEEAPDLSPLHKLLACLASFNEPVSATPKVHAQAVEAPMPTVYSQPLAHAEVIVPVSGSSVAEQREQVRQMLRQVRQWIDQHEPSGPVSVLLRQADRMWGKRFSEVASMIPPDLLQAWDRED
jgi:type VI secretion system protein ImpA